MKLKAKSCVVNTLKDCMCVIRYVIVTARRKSPFVIYSSVAYSKNMYPIRFISSCFLIIILKIIVIIIRSLKFCNVQRFGGANYAQL